ncbi:MAG: bifunctional DedA family/phosphatase PAP2 family protein [Gammaproteobacteria bacterium]
MAEGLLQGLLEWIAAHPAAAGASVALIAFAESLLLVGLVMPGAALLFGVGLLIASGALPLWPTLLWAAAGAMAGDWLSFFIGRYFERPLRRLWPLRNHPELIERGLRFIDRHGGKSLFIGRFVGPVRPVIPAVAGMLRMRTGRFLAISTVASLLWSPAYLLPGALFGASLGLASEVGGDLALLLLLLAALIWFSFAVVRRIYHRLQPRATEYLNRAALWGLRHPQLGRFTRGLIDPDRPDAGTLAAWAFVLLLAVWGFSSVLGSLFEGPLPTPFDRSVYDNLQGLRTPWMDHLMIRLTHLGDITIVGVLALLVTFWLGMRQRWVACAHWLGVVAFALAVPWLLKAALEIPRPEAIAGHFRDAAFPSGHATRAIVLFGFLAVLTARDFHLRWRWLPYTVALLLSLGVAASRLYLGAHWLTDVLGGLTLGLIWVTVLGIGFRRHDFTAGSGKQLAAVSLTLLLGGATLYSNIHIGTDLERYATHRPVTPLETPEWLSGGWQRLPAFRNDLRVRHNHPFTLQWAGDPQPLLDHLKAVGWQPTRPLGWRDTLLWLGANDETQRPILPQIHDGSHEALALWRPAEGGEERLVVRLWRLPFRLEPEGYPLYAGNVSLLATVTVLPAIVLPRTAPDFGTPLEALRKDIAPLLLAEVKRPTPGDASLVWSGRLLLLGPPELAPPTREPQDRP